MLDLSILINRSHFQLIALKPGIYKSHCMSRGVFECLHGIFDCRDSELGFSLRR